VWPARADREEGSSKETEGVQEEGCPEEERRFFPYENGGAFECVGV
jgi:hypothetical protein